MKYGRLQNSQFNADKVNSGYRGHQIHSISLVKDSIKLLHSSHRIDELVTCNISGKKARTRGLKLHMKKCLRDQDKADSDIDKSLAGRLDQNRRTVVSEPLTFDLQIDDTFECIISWQRNISPFPND